jgi:large subunit ribosomal protein L15
MKKGRKSTKMRGKGAGTHGWGARKKHKKSGHRGGKGMSGSGKRADHKKTLITNLYGGNYFGKKGVTSRGTKKDKSRKINLREIEQKLIVFVEKGIAKKTSNGFEINLKDHKILGTGNTTNKLIIIAKEASKSAIEKIKKNGGEIQLGKKVNKEKTA